ncbi:MAG: osmotically-inducible protein OsmY [Bacteroidia bacterium]|jgi:osmotically-inducible protein OsmY
MLASLQVDTIEDEPGYRTFGRIIEDDQVETKAIVNIHAANDLFHEAHITVVSYNGYLLLAGQVPNEAMKVQATEVVHKIKGVRRIYNELEIAAPSSGMTRTSDTWITAKVKSLLLGSSEIQGSRVKVVTENGVVFLMGLASSREAQRVADTASGISGAQRVVRLFELLE